MMPALEQNRSTGPNARSAAATSACTSDSRDTSADAASARWPPASISAATFAAPAASTSATTTPAAPASARARQMDRPMPLAPPVTMATPSAISMAQTPPGGGPPRRARGLGLLRPVYRMGYLVRGETGRKGLYARFRRRPTAGRDETRRQVAGARRPVPAVKVAPDVPLAGALARRPGDPGAGAPGT